MIKWEVFFQGNTGWKHSITFTWQDSIDAHLKASAVWIAKPAMLELKENPLVLEIISDQMKEVPVTSLICAALHQANT
jgi:hypothetical protein